MLLKGSPCQFAPTGAAGVNGFTCIDPRGYNSKIADLGLARPCIGDTTELTSDQWGERPGRAMVAVLQAGSHVNVDVPCVRIACVCLPDLTAAACLFIMCCAGALAYLAPEAAKGSCCKASDGEPALAFRSCSASPLCPSPMRATKPMPRVPAPLSFNLVLTSPRPLTAVSQCTRSA